MSAVLGPLWGTTKYEFRMQARRKALWISMLILYLLMDTGPSGWQTSAQFDEAQVIANWAMALGTFAPVIFGVLIADRLPRDWRLNVSELIETVPASPATHLIGKYLGAALATGLPIFLIFSAGVGRIAWNEGVLSTVPLGMAVFTTVILPGLLFVAAFSIACPAIIWAPLYQFLFVGYWFWGNSLSPGFGIPTLAGTHLMPIGENAAIALFGIYPSTIYLGLDRLTWVDAALSIGLLLAGAVVALIAVHHYLKWVRERR